MSGPGARRRQRPEEPEDYGIPITPLVDIVFLLLIFFLVATTFKDDEKDLTLSLPRAAAGKGGAARLDRVIINVRSDGTVLLGSRPTSRKDLFRALVEARRANPQIPVILRGDRSSSHGEVVEVLSVCQQARIRNVAVAVRQTGVADAAAPGSAEAPAAETDGARPTR